MEINWKDKVEYIMLLKINILIGFLLLSISSYGQGIVPVSSDQREAKARVTSFQEERFSFRQTPEWKRHKVLKACGWSTLGVGSAMMIVGFCGDVISNWEGPEHHSGFKIAGYVGVGVTASSIPLFVFSHKNKKKAKQTGSLSLNYSNIVTPRTNGARKNQPALAVNIYF